MLDSALDANKKIPSIIPDYLFYQELRGIHRCCIIVKERITKSLYDEKDVLEWVKVSHTS